MHPVVEHCLATIFGEAYFLIDSCDELIDEDQGQALSDIVNFCAHELGLPLRDDDEEDGNERDPEIVAEEEEDNMNDPEWREANGYNRDEED